MNKVRLFGFAMLAFGAYGSHRAAQATPTLTRDPIKISSHPNYQTGYRICNGLAETGLDSTTANMLVKAQMPMSETYKSVGSWLMSKPGDSRSPQYDETVNYLPMTNFVCMMQRAGRKVTFTKGGWFRRTDGFDVEGSAGRTHASLRPYGIGLDGEQRVIIESVEGIGNLNELEGGTMATCLATFNVETKLMSKTTDGSGGILGIVLGARSKESAALSTVCDLLAERVDG